MGGSGLGPRYRPRMTMRRRTGTPIACARTAACRGRSVGAVYCSCCRWLCAGALVLVVAPPRAGPSLPREGPGAWRWQRHTPGPGPPPLCAAWPLWHGHKRHAVAAAAGRDLCEPPPPPTHTLCAACPQCHAPLCSLCATPPLRQPDSGCARSTHRGLSGEGMASPPRRPTWMADWPRVSSLRFRPRSHAPG